MNANAVAMPLAAYARVPAEESRSLQNFEAFLHDCCSLSDEGEFWAMVADGIHSIQRAMDREQVIRFEFGVDRILALHGLPAWSAVKPGLQGNGDGTTTVSAPMPPGNSGTMRGYRSAG